MKYIKEELESLILKDKLPYTKIAKLYGVSDTYIKKISKKLGIVLEKRKIFPEGFIPANKKTNYCINCNQECNVHSKKYCSNKCQQEFLINKKYNEYLLNPNPYCNPTSSMKWIKKHILVEQNFKCNICSISNTWNGKPMNLILDHIDGNAANNLRFNLRLICHNCDSQLDTYKSKNKNSARKERYLRL
jgi:hypothetical protein